MAHIVVDDEQARIISRSAEDIEIRDQSGRHLGFVAHSFSDQDIATATERAASDEPRLTTGEVLDHLQSLETE